MHRTGYDYIKSMLSLINHRKWQNWNDGSLKSGTDQKVKLMAVLVYSWYKSLFGLTNCRVLLVMRLLGFIWFHKMFPLHVLNIIILEFKFNDLFHLNDELDFTFTRCKNYIEVINRILVVVIFARAKTLMNYYFMTYNA